jgi:polyhydroxybutyrate depolymerase
MNFQHRYSQIELMLRLHTSNIPIIMTALKLRLTVILVLLLSTSISSQEFEQINLVHDGIEREYLVYVPNEYDASISIPLVVNFHGFGGTAYDHYKYTSDMTSLADTANFLLVYPQGAAGSDGYSHWNIADENSKSDIDDLGFTSAMIDDLIQTYNVDTLRIYATGFSNGAAFTYDLACRLSQRIAAIAPVGENMTQVSFDECEATIPTGIISFHGTADESRPYNGIEGYNLSYEEINSFWTNLNETEAVATVTEINTNTEDGSSVELYSWEKGRNCSSVEHYKIINGGHSWPNPNAESWGKGDDVNRDIDTNVLIWNYVSEYDLYGIIGCEERVTNNEYQQLEYNFKLNQNYPNPFNPSTQIQYALPEATQVTLEVFNSVGQKVMELVNGLQSAGYHTATFNASGLSSGVYFYKLSTSSFINTKKMLLIK